MDLPPRIKTQFPNKDNIVNEDTPIPMESAFFIEDAEKDIIKPNRYYFNFPGNWITSNNGETIIGVRDIWMIKRKRRIKFSLEVIKINKFKYIEYKENHYNYDVNTICFMILNDGTTFFKINEDVSFGRFDVIYNISEDDDLYNFTDTFIKAWEKFLSENNNSLFNKDELKISQYYDSTGYHIKIETKTKHTHLFYIQLFNSNDDFIEVFNIGKETQENNYQIYFNAEGVPSDRCDFRDEIIFNNLWDRNPCKIYSSLAEQSLHHYIGNSNVYFSPIKYFKLQSTDQRFWVDFNSANHYNAPIKIPKNESFCIEIQFLSFNKTLNL